MGRRFSWVIFFFFWLSLSEIFHTRRLYSKYYAVWLVELYDHTLLRIFTYCLAYFLVNVLYVINKKGTQLKRGNFLFNIELKLVRGVKYSQNSSPNRIGAGRRATTFSSIVLL